MPESTQQSKLTFRAARTNLNLSLEEVAERVNMSPDELAEYENDNGEMPYSIAKILCRIYRISLSHIHIGKATT